MSLNSSDHAFGRQRFEIQVALINLKSAPNCQPSCLALIANIQPQDGLVGYILCENLNKNTEILAAVLEMCATFAYRESCNVLMMIQNAIWPCLRAINYIIIKRTVCC